MTDPTRPSNLESVVAAAARTGDPSDPDTLRRAAHAARIDQAAGGPSPLAAAVDDALKRRGLAVALGSPLTAEEKKRAEHADRPLVIFVTDDARIEAASRALHEAHLAVADAAGAWYDADPGDEDELRDTFNDLRAAVERWRAAGERFVRAVRGVA